MSVAASERAGGDGGEASECHVHAAEQLAILDDLFAREKRGDARNQTGHISGDLVGARRGGELADGVEEGGGELPVPTRKGPVRSTKYEVRSEI